MDILSPLPHVSNTRFRLAIKKYFYKDIEPGYTQQIKDLIVGDASETLDTLQELAAALNDDAEFYRTVTTKFDNLTQTVTNNELVTAAALNDLNTRTSTVEESVTNNELVITAALNDLNTRTSAIEENKADSSDLTTKFDNLTQIIIDNELVTADALNDLNTRTTAIEENIDATPTSGSDNMVKSGGVYTALETKADKATTLAGYGITDAKIQSGVITLGNNTITPLTSHLNISGKEDKMSIVAGSGTALTAAVNTAYTFASAVGALAITLPTPSDTSHVNTIVFWFTTSASPAVTFTSTNTVLYHDGYELEANTMYEVNAAYNGSNWVISSIKIATT